MPDYYLDAVNGDDSNGGTSLVDAVRTLAAAAIQSGAVAATNPRLLIKGRVTPSNIAGYATERVQFDEVHGGAGDRAAWAAQKFKLSWANKTDARIEPYNGKQVELRGDLRTDPASWIPTVHGSMEHPGLSTAVCTVAAVASRYDTLGFTAMDGSTLRCGWLRKAANLAACRATPGTWFQDSTALHVNDSPGANELSVVLSADYNVLTFDACAGVACSGVDIACHAIDRTGAGYGYVLQSCSDSVVRNAILSCLGYHSAGYVGSNVRNRFESITCDGFGLNTAGGGTAFVHFANSGNVTGGLYVGCRVHSVSPCDLDGLQLADPYGVLGPASWTSGGLLAYYSHTDGSGGRVIADLEYRDCRAYVYVDVPGSKKTTKVGGWGAGNIADYAGSHYEIGQRPVRLVDCRVVGEAAMNIEGSWSFDRCTLDFSNFPTALNPGGSGGDGTASAGCLRWRKQSGVGFRTYLRACDVLFKADAAGYVQSIQAFTGTFAAGDGVTFAACSILENGSGSNDCGVFSYNGKADFTYRVYGSWIGTKARSTTAFALCDGDNSISASFHEFRRNTYVGLGTGANRYSSNASFDTQAEWFSAIDTAGIARTFAAAKVADTPTALPLADDSPMRAGALIVSPMIGVSTGINGGTYSNAYGAWQYSSSLRRARPRMRRSR